MMIETGFGLGWTPPAEHAPYGPNPRAFGHPGAGGSLGFADLDANIGFGYTMNQMGTDVAHDPPSRGPNRRELRVAVKRPSVHDLIVNPHGKGDSKQVL